MLVVFLTREEWKRGRGKTHGSGCANFEGMTDRGRERTGRCKSGHRDGEEEGKTHGGE